MKPSACATLNLSGKLSGSGTINGTAASELILGSAGADTANGEAGDDCIVTGAGNDTLIGGAGTDVCLGGTGSDTYDPTCETRGDPDGFCFSPGSQTIVTDRDAHVQQQVPNVNAGTGSTLIVQSRASGRNMRTLVYFPLPNLPNGCSLTSATLRVYNKTPAGGRTIQALRITGSWTETGVTWNNQPATTGTAATSTSPSSASWETWTVTTQVSAMYTGGNNGFLLRDQTEESTTTRTQSYASREDAPNDPELVINWG